jgi:multiple antibiotic resistance protein
MGDLAGSLGVAFAALFPIVNPIGVAPVFYALTEGEGRRRRTQAVRTAVNVALILVIALFVGRFVLKAFGLELAEIRIAGGLIVAYTAWRMVNSDPRITAGEEQGAREKEDISFSPMAMPLLAGPGAIGVVVGIAAHGHSWQDYFGYVIGILLIAATVVVCLAASGTIFTRLGPNGVGVLNRVFGFLILAIAVALVARGVLALTG